MRGTEKEEFRLFGNLFTVDVRSKINVRCVNRPAGDSALPWDFPKPVQGGDAGLGLQESRPAPHGSEYSVMFQGLSVHCLLHSVSSAVQF